MDLGSYPQGCGDQAVGSTLKLLADALIAAVTVEMPLTLDIECLPHEMQIVSLVKIQRMQAKENLKISCIFQFTLRHLCRAYCMRDICVNTF